MHLCSYDCRTIDGSNSLTFESVFQVKLHYHEVSGVFTLRELEFKRESPKSILLLSKRDSWPAELA